MIDEKFVGYRLPSFTVDVEKGRLKFFASTIGTRAEVYTDEETAKSRGHRSILVSPTFLFGFGMNPIDPYGFLEEMGVPLGKVLHGEQTFVYHEDVYAGDTLTFEEKITDIYQKKGGALEFIVRDTRVINQNGDLVADLRNLTIVKH